MSGTLKKTMVLTLLASSTVMLMPEEASAVGKRGTKARLGPRRIAPRLTPVQPVDPTPMLTNLGWSATPTPQGARLTLPQEVWNVEMTHHLDTGDVISQVGAYAVSDEASLELALEHQQGQTVTIIVSLDVFGQLNGFAFNYTIPNYGITPARKKLR
jgi:hypothetical protein